MCKYITSDGKNWDDILEDDICIINEMKNNEFFYVVCLFGAKSIYDNVSTKQKCIDYIFDYLYSKEASQDTYFAIIQYTIVNIIISYAENKNLKIEIQVNNSINDKELDDCITEFKITSVKIEDIIKYEYEGVIEKYAQLYKIKFENGYTLSIITSEKRLVFESLFKVV